MIFGLYGIYGLYNFGCEAIIRGTYKFIRDCKPDAEIIYFSYNYDYDSKALADLDIKIIEIEKTRTLINRILNKALSLIQCEKRILLFTWQELIDQADVIVSIGGDMYTIPEARRNHVRYPYYNSLIDFCDRAISHGKQVIVYGASMGPWGTYRQAIDYYVTHISKYRYIICREYATLDYLKRVKIKKAIFQPDPAFLVQMRNNFDSSSEKKYIGINLSPLSLRELYGTCSDNLIERLSDMVYKIAERFDSGILFIPHVLSHDLHDNDEFLLRKIRSMLPECYQQKICFADTGGGYLGIKEQLRECKFVISARMHCAVNAVTEGVPAIFLSYSQKSQGMALYVYGTTKWVLSLKQIDDSLIPLMEDMDVSWQWISRVLIKRMADIREEYYRLQREQKLFKQI